MNNFQIVESKNKLQGKHRGVIITTSRKFRNHRFELLPRVDIQGRGI